MKSTKLEITKFKRNHLDWPKWRAYGRKPSDALLETIQNRDRLIVSITGNGIFFPKIISGTESETNERWSSFTSESYNWTKSIPAEKYGKSSEVANAHIKSVMVLVTINSTNRCKIHDFDKCFTSTHLILCVSWIKQTDTWELH